MAERARLAPLLAALALGGSADTAREREADLAQLLGWLPGSYDNGAQADADAARGVHPAHARVALVITKVYTPRLGRHVLYAQEFAADDPRRVMSERLLAFAVDERRGILETVYSFAEPLRWRDGQEHPELFTAVVAEDVTHESGCELAWRRDGARFRAAQDGKLCHTAAADPAADLSAEALSYAGYEFRRQR